MHSCLCFPSTITKNLLIWLSCQTISNKRREGPALLVNLEAIQVCVLKWMIVTQFHKTIIFVTFWVNYVFYCMVTVVRKHQNCLKFLCRHSHTGIIFCNDPVTAVGLKKTSPRSKNSNYILYALQSFLNKLLLSFGYKVAVVMSSVLFS